MTRLLARLGFRPYPDPAPARSGRCFDLASGPSAAPSTDTLAMYAGALALMTVVVAARQLPEVADVRADD